MIHCNDNARHHMSNVGVQSQIREKVSVQLFGCNGISEVGDETTMDDWIAELMQYLRQNNVEAATHIQERLLPKVVDNNRLKWNEAWLGQHQWTNNNSESANHLLKLKVVFHFVL